MHRVSAPILMAPATDSASWPAPAQSADAQGGQSMFSACAACHSLAPNRSMTGPSLSGVWDRKAGSLARSSRYSQALKSANLVWNDKTLDDWIRA